MVKPNALWHRLVSGRHSLDFWLRSMPSKAPRQPSLADMRAGLPNAPALNPTQYAHAQAQQQRLCASHPAMATWPTDLPPQVLADSLSVVHHGHDWLLPALAPRAEQPLRWLDIGCKNAAYALGLATLALAALPSPRQGLQLDALELDGGRRYRDGFTRAGYAQALLALTQDWLRQQRPAADLHGRFLQRDIRDHAESYNVITWLMPFVFTKPHLSWGLPLNYFDPAALTEHVLGLLKPGGVLMTLHLNPAEAHAQAACFHQARVAHEIIAHGPIDDPWLYLGGQRQVFVVKRR